MLARASELELINEERTRRLWANYSRNGWRRSEPLDDRLQIEEPRLLRRSFEILIEQRVQLRTEVSSALSFNHSDIEELANLCNGQVEFEQL